MCHSGGYIGFSQFRRPAQADDGRDIFRARSPPAFLYPAIEKGDNTHPLAHPECTHPFGAVELVAHGGWSISGQSVCPEDAVNPDGSTGTRSICRASVPSDTDTASDWHIVPTRGSTFGEENSDQVYGAAAAAQ